MISNLLQKANDKNILKNIIIGDRMWVYDYDIETKEQSSDWKIPALSCPKKAQQMHLRVKTVLLFLSSRHCAV
jgi:hypothetical protein